MVRHSPISETEENGPQERQITAKGFAALLEALGDGPSGGVRYEKLRAKLIIFFSRRLLPLPEDLADEVLDRLAFRISRGTQIDSIEGFALGIARYVALEQAKRGDLFQAADDTFFDNVPAISATQSREDDIVRMERCLKKLPSAAAKLLRDYYLSPPPNHIGMRRNLADALGISAIALRQRVFQARQKLRDCMLKNGRANKESR